MKNSLLIFVFIAIWSLGFTQTWNKVIVPTSENLNDIEFPDGTTGVGYIGGRYVYTGLGEVDGLFNIIFHLTNLVIKYFEKNYILIRKFNAIVSI